MFTRMREDLNAVLHHDPAAGGRLEVLLCHTALHAIFLYRAAHYLRVRLGVPIVPRLLSILARFWSGVEIHPDATIGRRFFIDHGTAVVIGATAEVGDDCIFFHNVTLGGTGHHHGKRHPTLGHNVFVGTGAILLGPIRVGDNAKIGANAFVRMHDVPPNSTVVGVPARIVKQDGEAVDRPLPPTELPSEAMTVPISTDRATGGSR